MKKTFLFVVLILLLAGCSSRSHVDTQVPDFPDSLGVSAPFAGFIGQELLVGGGCNFPDVPAAEGGKKRFYDAVYACTVGAEKATWTKVCTLPVPMAYGATVEVPGGLVLLGGQSAGGAHREVYLLHPKEGEYGLQTLPSLPVAIDNAAAALYGQTLYIAGGNQSDGGQALYALHQGDSIWQRLPDYPGGRRIQPVLLAEDHRLYLSGGFDNTAGRSDVWTDMLVYSIDEAKWTGNVALPLMPDGSPRACVGAAGVVAHSQFYITGGVSYSIFKAAISGHAPENYLNFPAEWYQFNSDLLVYHPKDNTWKVVDKVDGMAKAGGVLLHHDDHIYMVCGELKPGIRTPKIIVHPLCE